MEEVSIKLLEIFDNDLIKALLKNDCVIYGSFVRDVIVQGISLKEYSKKKYNVISCYSRYILSDIIERDIYLYTHLKTGVIETKQSKNTIITYEIEIDNNKFILEILYIRAIYGTNIYNFENDLNCIIDIDSLSLRRCGLYCLEIFYNSPFLFSDVIKNIKNKTFEFKTPLTLLSYEDIKYVQSLKNEGYKNRNNKLKTPNNVDILECSICYDNTDKNINNYSILECGHVYHVKCINEAIKTYFNNFTSEYYSCPYCSSKLLHTEIL